MKLNLELVNGYKKQYGFWSNKFTDMKTISFGFRYKVLILRINY